MFEDDLHVRRLREASGAFPEGCTCEDSLECPFCRYVVAMRSAGKQAGDPFRTAMEDLREEGFEFVVPASEDAQVYELRRMFRL